MIRAQIDKSESPEGAQVVEIGQFDDKARKALAAFAQRVSRRSFLSRAGRWAMAAIAVDMGMPVLPINRIPSAWADSCSDWWWCGMSGNRCNCCNGGTEVQCPSGCLLGHFWVVCCCNFDPGGGKVTFCNEMKYQDCCCSPGLCSCSSCWCGNEPADCGHGVCSGIGGNYCCTFYDPLASCTTSDNGECLGTG